MTRFRPTLCAFVLSMTLVSPVLAGNIAGTRSNGNIAGTRSNGNIAGTRTNAAGNIPGVEASRTDRQSQISQGVFALIRLMFETGVLF